MKKMVQVNLQKTEKIVGRKPNSDSPTFYFLWFWWGFSLSVGTWYLDYRAGLKKRQLELVTEQVRSLRRHHVKYDFCGAAHLSFGNLQIVFEINITRKTHRF